MLSKPFFEILFYILCAIGFIFQVFEISIRFFHYEVQTKIRLQIPNQFRVYDYAICARWTDLITGQEYIDDTDIFYRVLNNFTLKDIFEKSPDPQTIIESCVIRNLNSFHVSKYNKLACYELFEVTKFVVKEYVCYELHYRNESHRFNYLQLSRSTLYSKYFYYTVINQTSELNRIRFLSAFTYYPGVLIPYDSLGMANDVSTRRSDDSIFNHYTTRYQWFKTMNLEPPYVTNCYKYDKSSQSMCTLDCLKRGVVQLFNAWPLQVVANESLDIKLVDERNQTISSAIREIVEVCRAKDCPKKSCKEVLTSSQTKKDLISQGSSFSFLVRMPSSPNTYIESEPDMYAPQYVLYLMSLAGSWFGVSMLTFNPYALWRRIQKRNVVTPSSKNFITRDQFNEQRLRDGIARRILSQRLDTLASQYIRKTRMMEREIFQMKSRIENRS